MIRRGDFVCVPRDTGPAADVGIVEDHAPFHGYAFVYWFGAGRYYTEDPCDLWRLDVDEAEARARSLGLDLPVNATELGGES